MPTPRFGLAATTGLDGRIYALGGSAAMHGYGNPTKLVSAVEVYNPKSNTWTTVAPMPTPHVFLAAATGLDGRIYAIGGQSKSLGHLYTVSTVEVYTPATNTWRTVAPLSTPRDGLVAATGSDGRIYAIGGESGSAILQSGETYTPAASSTATPPTIRQTPTAIPGAVSFTVHTVKVAYGSADPTKAYRHPSLPTIKVGQEVKLVLYATFQGIYGYVPVQVAFRVIESGQSVAFLPGSTGLSTDAIGKNEPFLKLYRPSKPGTFTLSGTLYVGAKHQHKTTTFRVVSG